MKEYIVDTANNKIKISQLVKLLLQIKKIEGDLPVIIEYQDLYSHISTLTIDDVYMYTPDDKKERTLRIS